MAKKQHPYPEVAMGLEPGPFHSRIAERNFQHSWMNWMGFASPGVLDTVEFEYFAIRNQCTLFDISPMCKYEIEGRDAETVVNRLVTRDVAKLKPGRVAYVIWCDEDGNVVDDGTVFRLSQDRFRLCCQEPQLAWLNDIAWGFDVAVTDASRAVAALSLQGPTSFATLRQAGLGELADLAPFGIRDIAMGEITITVSRTGFTGDLGYELWTAPEHAPQLWDGLMEAGRLHGIRPIGYAAVEMARIEAGFLLPRADFLSSQTALRTDRPRNPLELGLDWLVHFDKPHFNGKRALEKLRHKGVARKLLAIEIDGDKAAHNALVYHGRKREVGMVTSALWSPTCKRNIAFAWLEAPFHDKRANNLWVEIYLQKELEWQRRMARCRIVEKPFFVHSRRTATPPGEF